MLDQQTQTDAKAAVIHVGLMHSGASVSLLTTEHRSGPVVHAQNHSSFKYLTVSSCSVSQWN